MITVKIHNSSICLVRNTSIEVGDKLKNLSETAEKTYEGMEVMKVANCERQSANPGREMKENNE